MKRNTLPRSSSLYIDVEPTTCTTDMIEAFLMKLKRGRFIPNRDFSMSLIAARQAAEILKIDVENICKRAQQHHISKSTLQQLHQPSLVGARRAKDVIRSVTSSGMHLLRASAFRLLISNVIRRVLTIIRESIEALEDTSPEAVERAIQLEKMVVNVEDVTTVTEGSSSDIEFSEENLAAFVKVEQQKGKKVKKVKIRSASEVVGDNLSFHSDEGDDKKKEGKDTAGTFPAMTDEEMDSLFAPPSTSTSSVTSNVTPSSVALPGTPPTDVINLSRYVVKADEDARRQDGKKIHPLNYMKFIDRAVSAIEDFEAEFDTITENMCQNAAKHLYEGEQILTCGSSHSTMSFLLRAAETKQATVYTLEGAPNTGAKKLADALREKGIESYVVPDSSCFALMSRMSKVFLSTENVLANGGLLAPVGTHPVCLAAQHFRVPVIVVTTTLKMCPYYPSDTQCTSLVKISRTESQEWPWSTFSSPAAVFNEDAPHQHSLDPSTMPEMLVVSPLMEYVPPELVSLFVTDGGEFTAPQIHRFIRDQYHPEDNHI